jgi:hypothetical protein
VNTPLVTLQFRNTNTEKSVVRYNELIRDPYPWCVHNRLFKANFHEKFK